MNRVKDNNYYQISGWMINRLNLKGNELQVFALIYGFSQDGESVFSGSLSYLCEWLGASKPTAIKALKSLTAQNLLIKEEKIINNVTFNQYKVNIEYVENLIGSKENLPSGKETLMGSKEILMGGSKETLPNNNNLDNELYNYSNNDVVDITSAKEALDYYEHNLGLLNSVLKENIKDLAAEVGIVAFKKAVDKSILSNKRNFFYIQKVARGIAAGDDWDNKQSKGNDDVWGNALNELEKEGLYDTAN